MLGHAPIAYDWLVIATGATHSYFGHDDWAPFAPGLKSLDDATAIRRRLLLAFEQAEMAASPEICSRLLTIVIVGGGPTGVEMAGAVAELARKALALDFREIDPKRTRVVLVEAGSRLLASFPERLSRYTESVLRRLGVEVRLASAVTHCGPDGVRLGAESIDAGTIIWAAGVSASPAAAWLGIQGDRAGRVPVTSDLRAPAHDNVFVIGDTALALNPDGRPVPGIAPAAKQEGAYVARALAARIAGREPPSAFVYADRGLLATIGRRAAVIAYKRVQLKGWLAWWLWGAAHIYFLVNLRNRIIVMTQWLWSYLVFERGARLITGQRAE
jgi:NADH dehydrogenase